MDMFMDKLAQKLNAQEIIRANTTADTEELNRLRGQLAAYEECLTRLQKLIDDGAERLEKSKTDAENVNRFMEEKMGAQQEEWKTALEEIRDGLNEQKKSVGDVVEERTTAINDNVHKECVKVYRNVQSVVVEECGKQKEAIAAISEKTGAFGGKLGAVLGISIAALVFSLASVVLQVLNLFNISLF